jgi:hypothetical protein
MDMWSLTEQNDGRKSTVLVENFPICSDCRVNIGKRAAENDRIRRGPEK